MSVSLFFPMEVMSAIFFWVRKQLCGIISSSVTVPDFSANQLVFVAIAVSVIVVLYRRRYHHGSGGGCSSVAGGDLSSIPGPWSLPIVGSLAFFRPRWFRTLSDIRRRYGDVYRLRIGSRDAVVICGKRAVDGALLGQSKAFAGRPDFYTFRLASQGKSMCFGSYSTEWTLHRRLADRVMKFMATSDEFVENCLRPEAIRLREVFLDHADRETGFDPDVHLLWSVAHVQYGLCYGDGRRDGDSFRDMIASTVRLIGCHNRGNAFDFFPWLRFVLGSQRTTLRRICDRMVAITTDQHAAHRLSFEEGRIRDALDALIQFGVREDCGLDEARVALTVQEFIGAGLDIVHAALHWTVLYVAIYSDVQKNIQDEIARTVGQDDQISREHVQRMPYTMAAVSEVLRHSSVVPLALPHSATRDAYLDGHLIPSGSFVLVNLYSVNHDEEFWTRPEVFDPERFLERTDEEEVRYRGDLGRDSMFGVGRRRCVGSDVSRLEMGLFLAVVLQRCNVSLSPASSVDRDSLLAEPRLGMILRPKPFSICVQRRSSL